MKTVQEFKKISHDLIQANWKLRNEEQQFFEEVAEKYVAELGTEYVYNENLGNVFFVIAIINSVLTDATLEKIEILKQTEIDKTWYVPLITILDLTSGETYKCDMSDLKDISYSDLGNLLLAELN